MKSNQILNKEVVMCNKDDDVHLKLTLVFCCILGFLVIYLHFVKSNKTQNA